jgi:SAM-dependent methyltransferase
MRSSILMDQFHENDFKPSELYSKYLGMLENDVSGLLIGRVKNLISCPACNSERTAGSFQKFGMIYHECRDCMTLYVSPCPSGEDVLKFYEEAPAENFWRNNLAKIAVDKREQKIILPRIEWMLEAAQEYLSTAPKAVAFLHSPELGYAKFINKKINTVYFIHPFVSEEALASYPSLNILSRLDELPESLDLITLFESLDHIPETQDFLSKVYNALKPGGLCFITSILSSGINILLLKEHASNLFPPDRLNLFSVEGLNQLFSKYDFEVLEFSTPGILDMEMLQQSIQQQPNLPELRFVRYLLENRDEAVQRSFQEFLQTSLMSSYGRILLRKR